MNSFKPALFDDHAQAIAKRQYMQPGDGDIYGMFRRVATWVASAEKSEQDKQYWSEQFYQLMASKRFCPGGRVLAGAGTQHGNVLNCFVQGATEHDPSSFEGIMEVATKLALVTKVGGGNGVNLDPYVSRKNAGPRGTVRGFAYIAADHADVEDFIKGKMRPPINPDGEKESITVRNWTRVVYGLLKPELAALARRNGVMTVREKPADVLVVPDDMRGIIEAAKAALSLAVKGQEPHVDFSSLRPEGAPIKGSGGTSSGPVSFLVEIFDNFLEWANLGAEKAGPVATLRYVYAPVLRVVRQGGCLHPDTLVHTDRGTLRLRELVDPYSRGWQRHTLSVATDEGWKASPEGYNNGIAETLKVVLENNLEIQGTPNHKLKVLRPDGRREWVPLEEIKPGDWVIQVLDQHTGTPITLAPLAETHFNARPIRTPEVLDERLAFFLGYLWGDGFVSDDRIGFAVAEDSPMIAETPELFQELFGLEVRLERKPEDKSVIFVTRSAPMIEWLRQNGLLKGKATELELPRPIRQSTRPVLGAFLQGLFEADGAITAGYPMLTTASKRLAQDVLVALGGLGIPAKIMRYNPLPGRFSKREHYRVRVMTAKGLERYLERVGVMPGSRFEALRAFKPDTRRESSWPFPHAQALLEPVLSATLQGRKGSPSTHTGIRKTLSRYIRGERSLTATGYVSLREDPLVGSTLPEFDFGEYYVQVRSVQPGGHILTLDLSVEENHTYLANGLVSHNTRRGAGMATIAIDHPDLLDFLTAKDLDREASEGDISTFNISILVTEAFWQTLQADGLWAVEPSEVPGKYYPYPVQGPYTGTLPDLPERAQDGARPIPVYDGKVPAKWLWHEIAWHAWATGEPGLIFIDRVNELSALKNLGEKFVIKSTNPCGEIPLTVGEPCDLGAINLAAYVENGNDPLSGQPSAVHQGEFNFAEFRKDVRTAIRFLDNVLDVNVFALEDNRIASQTLRRLGLGVMGLADMLIKMGLPYSSEAGRRVVAQVMNVMREEAIAESERLGQERGVFPLYEQNRAAFEALGIRPRRNVAVLTVAPTGTTSMLMGVSSGIEPMFSPFMWRRIGGEYKALLHPLFVEMMEQFPASGPFEKDGAWNWDAIIEAIQANHGSVKGLEGIPSAIASVFEGAHDVPPLDHVRMQGVVQTAFDAEGYAANSLSKTINLPNQATVEDVEAAYTEAYMTGCKGITVYRDGSREYQVLSVSKEEKKEEKAEGNSKETVVVQPALLDVPPSTASSRPEGERTARPIFERTGRLVGYTDMVKLTAADGTRRGFLVTVNMQGEHPVEVILTSGKAGDEANADSEALGRIISKALQYGVPVAELVKTLRGINGGLYGSYQGRFVTSKADLIAVALETTSKIQIAEAERKAAQMPADEAMVPQAMQRAMTAPIQKISVQTQSPVGGKTGLGKCPECGDDNLVREEGCTKCYSCGYSKCG
ncbi:adenosylcobalamin-dependent ribonucleoside-diphosphate reductase [Meiothermus cerbereus]|uniref:adenosylcobalamin-dependent ribonucleoside-diphosphate reductase n=1 Tax=Meiothermus cerbereus TaxID=65552 RepID=UPI003EEA73CC